MDRKILIVAVRDAKTEMFMQPWFAPTPGVAERSFTEAVNANREHDLVSKYPEDFALFRLGTFDEVTGKIEGDLQPQQLVTALQVRRVSEPTPIEEAVNRARRAVEARNGG